MEVGEFVVPDTEEVQSNDARKRLGRELGALRLAAGEPTIESLAGKVPCSRTTLSLAFNGRHTPNWQILCRLTDLLGGDLQALRPLWIAARREESTPIDEDPDGADSAGPAELPRAGVRRRWPLVVGAAVIGVLVAAAGVLVAIRVAQPPTDPGASLRGEQCVRVTAEDVRVFKAETGEDRVWTRWPKGTKFWVMGHSRKDDRYRTVLRNGQDGWVTSLTRYVTVGQGCPIV